MSQPDSPDAFAAAAIDFYERLAAVKKLRRRGWVEHGVPQPESVADHMLAVALLAAVIARRRGLDLGRAVTAAVLHDLAESVVGDIIPNDGVSVEEKRNREESATAEILGLVDSSGELFSLWKEFEYHTSDEGILVGQLDKLEMLLQAARYERESGVALDPFFEGIESMFTIDELRSIARLLMRRRLHGDGIE